MTKNIGFYVHVPFCVSKCPYCDFYSIKGNDSEMAQYTDAVLNAVVFYATQTGRKADTLYFGGGTPSVLGGERLGKIVDRIREKFLTPNAEITVEVNPSGQNLENLFQSLVFSGVNRISMGMQSAVDSERLALGRKASSKDVENAINLARQSGIFNISLDLMLGIPNMTMESLNKSLDFILGTGVPHVSAYMLKIEKNTRFYTIANTLNLPNEDQVCDMYLHTAKRLNDAGIHQYEVSNFAKKGFESRHNLKYWQCEEYIGIGPSAHMFVNGKRYFYPRDMEFFLKGNQPIFDDNGGGSQEKIMLGLRLTGGIEKTMLSQTAIGKTPKLINAGYMTESQNIIALTPKGFLISNSIIAELIE